MDKAEIIQKAYDFGFEYEMKYGNCAQCTVAAVQDALGIQNDAVFQAASGLGGGIGRNCDGVCGGYSGGVMMLSSFVGRTRENFTDRDSMLPGYTTASQLREQFLSKFGTVTCQEIHKGLFGRTFNLWDPNEMTVFNEMGAHVDKCTSIVGQAAAWTAEILLNEMEKKGSYRNVFTSAKKGSN